MARPNPRTTRDHSFLPWLVSLGMCLLIPGLMLLFGVDELRRNSRALSWTTVPAQILSCTPRLEEETRDEDNPETQYAVYFRISYQYEFQGKNWMGNFQRGQSLGSKLPDGSQVASLTRAFRETLGDGFAVRVNPDNPAESQFDPSLLGGVTLTLFGVLCLIVILLLFRRMRQPGAFEGDPE